MVNAPCFFVNAFTNATRPFAGNPAAVILLPHAVGDELMRATAKDLGLVTVFSSVNEKGERDIRWLTPTAELDLCGHGTLACSHVLFSEGFVPGDSIHFTARERGVISVHRDADAVITLSLPYIPLTACSEHDRCTLVRALGVACSVVGQGQGRCLVEVASLDVLRSITPNHTELLTLSQDAVVVTCQGDGSGYDFHSRFFAPRWHLPEDPVCGSAHCWSALFWREKLNKTRMRAHMASERGGDLLLTCTADRLLIGGQGVTRVRGQCTFP